MRALHEPGGGEEQGTEWKDQGNGQLGRPGGWRDWGPGLLTSRDFCELVEGWHSLQFVRVHLGCLSLQIPGFNLLPGPWHATVEDTAKSDNYREDRAGLARARAQTPQEWHPNSRPVSIYLCGSHPRVSLQEVPPFDKTLVGSEISQIPSPSRAGFR